MVAELSTRLLPQPLTPEDQDIWTCVGLWGNFTPNNTLELLSIVQDTRDAGLMLRAQGGAGVGEWHRTPGSALWLAFDEINGTIDGEFGGCDVCGMVQA